MNGLPRRPRVSRELRSSGSGPSGSGRSTGFRTVFSFLGGASPVVSLVPRSKAARRLETGFGAAAPSVSALGLRCRLLVCDARELGRLAPPSSGVNTLAAGFNGALGPLPFPAASPFASSLRCHRVLLRLLWWPPGAASGTGPLLRPFPRAFRGPRLDEGSSARAPSCAVGGSEAEAAPCVALPGLRPRPRPLFLGPREGPPLGRCVKYAPSPGWGVGRARYAPSPGAGRDEAAVTGAVSAMVWVAVDAVGLVDRARG